MMSIVLMLTEDDANGVDVDYEDDVDSDVDCECEYDADSVDVACEDDVNSVDVDCEDDVNSVDVGCEDDVDSVGVDLLLAVRLPVLQPPLPTGCQGEQFGTAESSYGSRPSPRTHRISSGYNSAPP